MVFGKKKADAAKGAAKTLAPIPGKAFGVSGKQKKATGAALPDKTSVSETDSQDGKTSVPEARQRRLSYVATFEVLPQ